MQTQEIALMNFSLTHVSYVFSGFLFYPIIYFSGQLDLNIKRMKPLFFMRFTRCIYWLSFYSLSVKWSNSWQKSKNQQIWRVAAGTAASIFDRTCRSCSMRQPDAYEGSVSINSLRDQCTSFYSSYPASAGSCVRHFVATAIL